MYRTHGDSKRKILKSVVVGVLGVPLSHAAGVRLTRQDKRGAPKWNTFCGSCSRTVLSGLRIKTNTEGYVIVTDNKQV